MMTQEELAGVAARERAAIAGMSREAKGAILGVLRRAGEGERDAALQPGLCNENRQYNAGRAAAVLDVERMLGEMMGEGGGGE